MITRLKTKDDAALTAFVREHCPSKRLGERGEHEDTCPGCLGLSRTLTAFLQALAPAGNNDPHHTAANAMLDAFAGAGCLGRSAPDEPVFILVARDVTAAETVRAWAGAYVNAAVQGGLTTLTDGCPVVGKARDAIEIARAMDDWRVVHGGKVPD